MVDTEIHFDWVCVNVVFFCFFVAFMSMPSAGTLVEISLTDLRYVLFRAMF